MYLKKLKGRKQKLTMYITTLIVNEKEKRKKCSVVSDWLFIWSNIVSVFIGHIMQAVLSF